MVIIIVSTLVVMIRLLEPCYRLLASLLLKGSYVVLLGYALECLMLGKLGFLLNNKLGLHQERVYRVGLLLLLSYSHQYFILG